MKKTTENNNTVFFISTFYLPVFQFVGMIITDIAQNGKEKKDPDRIRIKVPFLVGVARLACIFRLAGDGEKSQNRPVFELADDRPTGAFDDDSSLTARRNKEKTKSEPSEAGPILKRKNNTIGRSDAACGGG